ncbi:NlpC/P60 family protein [Yersinia rochesterensis]|nr:NlpC/P60 family protein [Yersinia rochesterensis]
MNKTEFIKRMIGIPWANRACDFECCDCWGLVVLYYRHVLGREIHSKNGYESKSEFLTCFKEEVVYWRKASLPVNDGIFVGYVGKRPEHVGLIIDGQALHSRGENGAVRMDRLRIIEKTFTRLEFFEYATNRDPASTRLA